MRDRERERERGLGLGSGWKSARIGVRVGPRGQPLGLELAVLRHSVSRYRLGTSTSIAHSNVCTFCRTNSHVLIMGIGGGRDLEEDGGGGGGGEGQSLQVKILGFSNVWISAESPLQFYLLHEILHYNKLPLTLQDKLGGVMRNTSCWAQPYKQLESRLHLTDYSLRLTRWLLS